MAGADDIVHIHYTYVRLWLHMHTWHTTTHAVHMRSTTVTARLLCRDSDYFWDSVQHCTIQIAELRV